MLSARLGAASWWLCRFSEIPPVPQKFWVCLGTQAVQRRLDGQRKQLFYLGYYLWINSLISQEKIKKYLISRGWEEPLLHSGSSWAWNPSVLSLSPLSERFLLLEPNPGLILGEISNPSQNSVAFPVICQDSNLGGNFPSCFSHHWRKAFSSNFRIFFAVLQPFRNGSCRPRSLQATNEGQAG